MLGCAETATRIRAERWTLPANTARRLARKLAACWKQKLQPVHGRLRSLSGKADLPLQTPPARESWKSRPPQRPHPSLGRPTNVGQAEAGRKSAHALCMSSHGLPIGDEPHSCSLIGELFRLRACFWRRRWDQCLHDVFANGRLRLLVGSDAYRTHQSGVGPSAFSKSMTYRQQLLPIKPTRVRSSPIGKTVDWTCIVRGQTFAPLQLGPTFVGRPKSLDGAPLAGGLLFQHSSRAGGVCKGKSLCRKPILNRTMHRLEALFPARGQLFLAQSASRVLAGKVPSFRADTGFAVSGQPSMNRARTPG